MNKYIIESYLFFRVLKKRLISRKFILILQDLKVLSRRLLCEKKISKIPHHISLYQRCLLDISLNKRYRFISLEEHIQNKFEQTTNCLTCSTVIRHDHDGGMIDPILFFTDIEESMGLRSSIHVMVDGDLYKPQKLSQFWLELSKRGFDVGLHTQSWRFANFVDILKKEISIFFDLLGFYPKTFSFHGSWPRSKSEMKNREVILREINKYIQGTSLIGYANSFDWVVEDSARAGKPVELLSSFVSPTKFNYFSDSGLVLTHDGIAEYLYWKR